MKKTIISTIIFLTVPLISHASINSNLSYGMSGPAVFTLQSVLVESGCLNHVPTAYFGQLTMNALECWQAKNNIPTTGQVDATTMTAMNKILNNNSATTNTNGATASTLVCPAGYTCSPTTPVQQQANYSASTLATELSSRLAFITCDWYSTRGGVLFTKSANGLLGPLSTEGNYFINTILDIAVDTSYAGYPIYPSSCSVSFPAGASLYAGGLSTFTLGFFGTTVPVVRISNMNVDFSQIIISQANNYLANYAQTNNYCSVRPSVGDSIAVFGWPISGAGQTLTGNITGTSGYFDTTNITVPNGMQGSTAVSLVNGCVIGQINSLGKIADQYQLSYLFGN